MLFGPELKNKSILPEDWTQKAQLPLVPHYRVITFVLCFTVDFLIYYDLYMHVLAVETRMYSLTFILSPTLVINDSFRSPTLKIINSNTIIINNNNCPKLI